MKNQGLWQQKQDEATFHERIIHLACMYKLYLNSNAVNDHFLVERLVHCQCAHVASVLDPRCSFIYIEVYPH